MPEHPVAESTVRNHVNERKRALGLLGREIYVPQSYAWGDEAQVDWYEAEADLGEQRLCLQVFCMRAMAGAFHRAYLSATQQAFLEAHELAFRYFGGVFRVLRYDNLGSAVQKVLRGRQCEETERFIAFRSHWRFRSEFCMPAAGHEKGGGEGENGYFRRNHLVPVPRAADLGALNGMLLVRCREDKQRRIAGREQTVGEALAIERDHLLALAGEGFDLAEVTFPVIDGAAASPSRPTPIRCQGAPAHGSRPSCIRPTWRSGTRAAASRVTSAATRGVSRSWTWSTTSTSWSTSPVRWPVRGRSNNGGGRAAGRPASTRSGSA